MFGGQTFMFEPTLNLFLVTCPRLDPNDGITTRGCAWMSPEETVGVFVQCVYTDVAKTSISSFRRVGTAFSGELPQAWTAFTLRQLLWPDYSTYKSFDSSTNVIPSLHVISLAVRDRQ